MLTEDDAQAAGLAYDYVAAWITLLVNSTLEEVGLTAAFSAQLAAAGISCNVVAGFHHDHLFVPHDRAAEAIALLEAIERGYMVPLRLRPRSRRPSSTSAASRSSRA